MISFDPLVDPARGERLTQRLGWKRVADLTAGYIQDVSEVSGGLVQYQVVGQLVADEFPVKADGFRYTAASYLDVAAHRAPGHEPDWVDYHRIISEYRLGERVQSGEVDEIWLFGFPNSGFYESRMVGRGAFWCNAPPLGGTDSFARRFVVMGFSYERGVGEMLEDLGHRAESILAHISERSPGVRGLWQRFTRYDRAAPGQAEVGTVHFAPNSERDYDWGNRRPVPSRCDAWREFPPAEIQPRVVTCSEWGNGDTRLHHRWWLSHLPKASGTTDGFSNNWWQYIIRVDDPLLGAI